MSKLKSFLIPFAFTLTPIIGSSIQTIYYRKNFNDDWSKSLIRAPWTPPDYVFGPVWTVLYLGMGFASYLVHRSGGGFSGPAKIPLALYGCQLVLNWAWPPLFFVFHQLKWSLVEICVLTVNVAGCISTFYGVNKTASYIMVPYIVWLSLATSLTYYIYKHNPDVADD